MSRSLDGMQSSQVWCGRSWEGLVDRRCAFFQQAKGLRHATHTSAHGAVTEFLEFFDSTGVELLRDEEEWIFRSLSPTPQAVIDALQEHIQISSLIQGLIREAQVGCVDLRVVHGLGELIQNHLLTEEEEIRPRAMQRPRLTSRVGVRRMGSLAMQVPGADATQLKERT